MKQPTIEYSKNKSERFNYKAGTVSASDRRFEHSPNKLESLSKHRNQPKVDFERYSHRGMNVFEENKFINPGTGRKQAKSQLSNQFYDNTTTKDRVLKRPINIVPKFDKQIGRPS